MRSAPLTRPSEKRRRCRLLLVGTNTGLTEGNVQAAQTTLGRNLANETFPGNPFAAEARKALVLSRSASLRPTGLFNLDSAGVSPRLQAVNYGRPKERPWAPMDIDRCGISC